jgi:DNA-3-methyladenine glycosylase
VEVEAYLGPEDLASHARFGRTPRVATMYGPPGLAYVYRVYGMYACLNVVTGPAGVPSAVLIRAVAPLEGEGALRTARLGHELNRRRGTRTRGSDPAAEEAAAARVARLPFARLASGPGLVGAAFDIDTSLDGLDLCDPASILHLAPAPADEPAPVIQATARIGVGYAGPAWAERRLRFLVTGDPSVSGPGPRR